MSITTETRHRAASLALVATIGLTGFKLAVAWLSGSVGMLSEGVHSFLDLVSAALSYFTVREAAKPADADHPFGHGKIETLSSLFESVLLGAAAVLITIEGLEHYRNPQPVAYQWLAIATITASMIASYVVYRHNHVAAVETESSALHVNSLHFLSDVVASAAVLAGLLLLRLTGWLLIDPIMAFAVAGYIFWISLTQVRVALRELSDRQLPESEIQLIRTLLDTFHGRAIEAHDLRTRKSGAVRHIDFHLVCCGQMTVGESHSVCDEIEGKILGLFPRASVNIHVEPCESAVTQCCLNCPIFQARQNVAGFKHV